MFDPAAKSALEAIAPVPAFKTIPEVAKVTSDPPEELLRIERFSFPVESESEEMLPDKLIASISVVSLAAPMVTNPDALTFPPDAMVNWSPELFAPCKTTEVAETGVFMVITFPSTVRALIPETVSVPEPSPKVTSPAVATFMSKLSAVPVSVPPNETSSESVPPDMLRAMSELKETGPM